ncbi:MAG: hypothetical protein V3W19_04185 [Desulfatiglandales bacterium]
MNSELLGTLSTLITIGLAFGLIYHLWQSYIIDVTRQQLFELRNEVFDMIGLQGLSREDDAYQLVRAMFNSSIRFVHKLNLLHALFIVTMVRFTKKMPVEGYAEKVKNTIYQIENKETRDRLWHILGQMHLILAWHLVRVSPVVLIITIVVGLVSMSISSINKIREKFGNTLNGITYSDAIQHSHSIQH